MVFKVLNLFSLATMMGSNINCDSLFKMYGAVLVPVHLKATFELLLALQVMDYLWVIVPS